MLELAMALVTTIGMRFLQVWYVSFGVLSFQIIVILNNSHTQKARKLGARGCHICILKSKTVLMIIFDLYLGGKMNFILIGGAPLSQTTHDFIRVCLGSIVVQGYR